MLDSGISNVTKHCSANVLAVVTTILPALSMQTMEEQLSAKHTDLVFAEGQGSGPPLGCGNVRVTGRWILLENWCCSSALVEYDCVDTEVMRAVLEGIFANIGACQKRLTSWELTPGSFTFCSWSNFLSDLLTTNICWKRLFCKLLHYLFFTCDVMLF